MVTSFIRTVSESGAVVLLEREGREELTIRVKARGERDDRHLDLHEVVGDLVGVVVAPAHHCAQLVLQAGYAGVARPQADRPHVLGELSGALQFQQRNVVVKVHVVVFRVYVRQLRLVHLDPRSELLDVRRACSHKEIPNQA